jgi:hypothetical protein
MVALLQRIESRTTRSERFIGPRIDVAVNIVHHAPSHAAHKLGAPLVRPPTRGQQADERRAGRLIRRPGAVARVQLRPAAAHPRPPLDIGAAPVELSPAAVGTVHRAGEHRGLIVAPAARMIGLSVTAPHAAARRLSIVKARSADDERRVRDTGAETAPGAPINIEHLTDKVVAAIDRRLWSHRERMGGR